MPKQGIVAERLGREAEGVVDIGQRVVRRFQALPAFAQIAPARVEEMIETADVLRYAAEERILDIGEAEPGVFILTEGDVDLRVAGEGVAPVVLERVGPGGVFGEAGLFGRAISPVQALALSDCEAVRVSHEAFARLLKSEAALGEGINALINQRIAAMRRISAQGQATADRGSGGAQEVGDVD